jgi:hypothetical protein
MDVSSGGMPLVQCSQSLEMSLSTMLVLYRAARDHTWRLYHWRRLGQGHLGRYGAAASLASRCSREVGFGTWGGLLPVDVHCVCGRRHHEDVGGRVGERFSNKAASSFDLLHDNICEDILGHAGRACRRGNIGCCAERGGRRDVRAE